MDQTSISVLNIEGNPDEAAIIESYLASAPGSRETYAVTQASRLSTACHLLAQRSFDVILIDLVLPLNVGLEGFQRIRALRPRAPIIVLTGLQDEPLAIQALHAGAQDYLVKGSPDCCLLKRAIRYSIEKKRLLDSLEVKASEGLAPEKAREVAGRADIQGRFMSRVAHELRNIHATLMTAAYCLQNADEPLTPRQSQLTEMLARNVKRQTKIIDNFLDLTRIQSGKLRVNLQDLDLSAIITDLAQEYGLRRDGPSLQLDVPERLSPVAGDPDLIAQVLRNLIDNSLRYARKKVVLKATDTERKDVLVSVLDDGAGIPAENLGKLFHEFVQLEQPEAGTGYKGMGLGLTICKEIIEGHAGRIWAENVAGQGARFSFILPARDAAGRPIDVTPRRQMSHRPAMAYPAATSYNKP